MNHFESRLDVMDGKGIIVCMSIRICIDLYDQIIKLRPNLHNEDDREFISLAAGQDISILFFIYYCIQLESGIGGIGSLHVKGFCYSLFKFIRNLITLQYRTIS